MLVIVELDLAPSASGLRIENLRMRTAPVCPPKASMLCDPEGFQLKGFASER